MRKPALAVAAIVLVSSAAAAATPPDSIHAPANGCFALQAANGRFVERSGEGYAATAADAAGAAGFFMKATELGSYLLLSGYDRAPGERGAKELLGLRDPAGELLDAAGKLVRDAAVHVSALGDMADFALDPVAPAGRTVRQAGEAVGEAGSRIADRDVAPTVAMLDAASDLAVWNLGMPEPGSFTLTARATGGRLAAADDGALGLAPAGDLGPSTRFRLVPRAACNAYPEADRAATVEEAPVRYQAERSGDAAGLGDEVFGWVDAHAHVTAYEFIGGRVNYGAPFHEFGVDHALDDCSENHGPYGLTGTVEMVTSEDAIGPHETRGWPTFEAWPRHSSLQHHQSYYVWIERAFLAGEKILVNLITHNEILCQMVPQKKNDCDGMANIRLQAQRTYEMQDYVDAQSGGPGTGWFRVVTSPAEARRVIDDGKMAVVLGVEMEKVLNCGEFLDQPECTRDDIRSRLDELHDLGVRVLFPVHKFDNAFGGHLPHSGFAIGTVLTAGNLAETGHPLEVEPCPKGDDGEDDFSGDPNDPRHRPEGIVDYLLANLEYDLKQLPSSRGTPFEPYDPRGSNGGTDTGELCNVRGLTDLGHYLVDELMRRRMMIDVDHMSRRAASALIDVASAHGYPVISSHDWTGSEQLLDRIAAGGGFIARFARGGRDSWVNRLLSIQGRPTDGFHVGLGIATDVNGIAQLPADPSGGDATSRITYPFRSYDGKVLFGKQVTGDREFGLYDGRGVAHYGLYADLIADLEQHGGPRAAEALDVLFRSAEAYLQTWERAAGEG